MLIKDQNMPISDKHDSFMVKWLGTLNTIAAAAKNQGLDPDQERLTAAVAMLDAALCVLAMPGLKQNDRVDRQTLLDLVSCRIEAVEISLTDALRPFMQKGGLK